MPIIYVVRRILCDLLKQYPGEQRLFMINRMLLNQYGGGICNPVFNAGSKMMLIQTHRKH